MMTGNTWYVAQVRIEAEENIRLRCQEAISSKVLNRHK